MNGKSKSVNIVAFASGSGSNFKSIHHEIKIGQINAEIKLLVSNNPQANILSYANTEGIPIFIHNKARFPSKIEYIDSLLKKLKKANADLNG